MSGTVKGTTTLKEHKWTHPLVIKDDAEGQKLWFKKTRWQFNSLRSESMEDRVVYDDKSLEGEGVEQGRDLVLDTVNLKYDGDVQEGV